MRKVFGPVIGVAMTLGFTGTGPALAQQSTIRIGINTAIQLQVGRDTIDAIKQATEEINAQGGVLGRKFEVVIADEGEAATEGPKVGIAAVNKLTGEDKVNVLIGGYDSGVTLGELPHIVRAKTIFLGIGAASPAIQQKVKDDYEHYKYIFRVNPINSAKQAKGVIDFIAGNLKGQLGYKKISIIGENAKWVQDIVPALKKGAQEAGLEVPIAEFFDVQTADFSPIFTKVKDSGSEYLLVILSHGASDVFVKQWYDAKVPLPIGGIDVKSMDANFFDRVGGKAIGEVTTNYTLRAPLTEKTIPWWDNFVKAYQRAPVYTAGGAYDAVYIYANAVKAAGSTDTDAVIKQLEKTDYVGVRGRVQFDELHEVKDGPGFVNQLFVQWQDKGERKVVWPKEIANGKMINPPWMPQK
ncbi:MAG TPA: ABC transporter substrate-binding protein [Xanthobacteraceae bacterium]|jgi:branched-chain amino acid transport system substrate-binding protein|nr:ABC transporter substrate-binding protein [Xanthobacteraceae bacterium]